MIKKTTPSEKKLRKLAMPLISEECDDKADVKATNCTSHQRAKVRRKVKLPRLKLEDLVAQVTEENAHKEISPGPAVGNEVW